jgi:hypothetical protein
MNLVLIYTASGAVVLGLVIFALAVLLGVYLIRLLQLPQELPMELHFSPAPPPIHPPVGREQATVTAALQARLSLIHARARETAELAQGLQELNDAAKGSPASVAVEAQAARALSCAKEADAARSGAVDEADRETARLLAQAKEAYAAGEAAFPPPQRSQRLLVIMLVIAAILVLTWTVVMITHHGSRPG